ncbi:MAG: alpha/beta fold hydrolase [Parvularculaceae bacterium]
MTATLRPVAAWRDAARRFAFGDDRLAWWTSGESDDDRPWLLLIHGFPTSSWDWSAVWPALAERFNLLALDMLGFGLSDKPTRRRYSIFAQADLQEALLEFVGLGEAHVLAHDYGDTVAQELLARHNERALSFNLKSVAFLNGGVFQGAYHPLPIQRLAASPLGPIVSRLMTRERFAASFSTIFAERSQPTEAELDAHWSLILENGGARILHKLIRYMGERETWRDRWGGAIEEARAPTAMIVGADDPISGAQMLDAYRERAPGAADGPRATLLDGIGHYPQIEAPARCLEAFFAFHDAGFVNA